MKTYAVSFVLAFFVSLAVTPLLIAAARRWRLVDKAGRLQRKVHAADIPRVGGVAIVAAFYAPMLGLLLYETGVGDNVMARTHFLPALLGGGAIIALLGIYDDLVGSGAKLKLSVQVVVATGVVALGFRISVVALPFLPELHLGLLAWPVTILWIVGVTNAVNLIDGLDGLAGGLALFGLLPVAAVAVMSGSIPLALITAALAGAVLGFLVFNFHPARIFMGDSGSMFLGFTLALVTVESSQKGSATVALLTPVLALGVPIMDTLLAIARRMWLGRPIFTGDRDHIHHRLMRMGLSHRRAVLAMYGMATAFTVGALTLALYRNLNSGLVLAVSVLLAAVLMRSMGYLSILNPNPGRTLRDATNIRSRNRVLRQRIRELDVRARAAGSLDEAVALAGELATLVGASAARLEIPAVAEAGPVRIWIWGGMPAPADAHHVALPLLAAKGHKVGRLELAWHREELWDDGTVHAAEGGCDEIAAAVARHLDEGVEFPGSGQVIPLPSLTGR